MVGIARTLPETSHALANRRNDTENKPIAMTVKLILEKLEGGMQRKRRILAKMLIAGQSKPWLYDKGNALCVLTAQTPIEGISAAYDRTICDVNLALTSLSSHNRQIIVVWLPSHESLRSLIENTLILIQKTEKLKKKGAWEGVTN